MRQSNSLYTYYCLLRLVFVCAIHQTAPTNIANVFSRHRLPYQRPLLRHPLVAARSAPLPLSRTCLLMLAVSPSTVTVQDTNPFFRSECAKCFACTLERPVEGPSDLTSCTRRHTSKRTNLDECLSSKLIAHCLQVWMLLFRRLQKYQTIVHGQLQ
ncbi:hypothetical protein HDK64DRAFT_270432 [Phyllosticta capitalensis]